MIHLQHYMQPTTEDHITNGISEAVLGIFRDWPRYLKSLLCALAHAACLPLAVILCRNSGERFARFTLFIAGWALVIFVIQTKFKSSGTDLDVPLLFIFFGLSLGFLLHGKWGTCEQDNLGASANSRFLGSPRGQVFWSWLCCENPVAALGASAIPWFIAGLSILQVAPVVGTILVNFSVFWWAYLLLSWLLERETILDNRDAKPHFPLDPDATLVEGIPPTTKAPANSIFQN